MQRCTRFSEYFIYSQQKKKPFKHRHLTANILMAPHTQHHHSSVSSASFAPYSIPNNHNHTSSVYKEGSAGPNQFSSSLPISTHQHASNPFTANTTFNINNNNQGIPNATNNNGQSVTYLSRRFVARRISEGETGRLKEELKCQACGKGYKHISSLAKHLWEHTPEWSMTSKLLISKHQQVQLLEAASILVSLNEDDEENDFAVKTDLEDSHFAKLHQHHRDPSISSVSFKTSMSDNDEKSSPYTSPSLAEDSSTPSPPPQPLTPQTKYSTSVTNQSDKSYTGRHHSRSDSLSSTSAMATSPALSTLPSSSSMITDSLFPASSSYTGSTAQPNLSSSLIGTKSSLRYDDLLSADNIGKRKVIKNMRSHSVRSYSRRMSALNPPSKVSTNLTLDYDDEEEEDENVVVDDLDDECVFGAMD